MSTTDVSFLRYRDSLEVKHSNEEQVFGEIASTMLFRRHLTTALGMLTGLFTQRVLVS